MYEDHYVMFFQDITTGLHKKRKRFDDVKQWLRDLKIDYGIACIFAGPAGVELFIKELET